MTPRLYVGRIPGQTPRSAADASVGPWEASNEPAGWVQADPRGPGRLPVRSSAYTSRKTGSFKRLFALAVIALFVDIAPAADAVRSLTILHTNDLHARLTPSDRGAGGFAQLAAAIRHERENCGSCLLLNAGDLVQGSPVSTVFHGIPVYRISNLFGFDA